MKVVELALRDLAFNGRSGAYGARWVPWKLLLKQIEKETGLAPDAIADRLARQPGVKIDEANDRLTRKPPNA